MASVYWKRRHRSPSLVFILSLSLSLIVCKFSWHLLSALTMQCHCSISLSLMRSTFLPSFPLLALSSNSYSSYLVYCNTSPKSTRYLRISRGITYFQRILKHCFDSTTLKTFHFLSWNPSILLQTYLTLHTVPKLASQGWVRYPCPPGIQFQSM